MKIEKLVKQAYENARLRYKAIGIDTDKVIDTMDSISLSLHCWQTDDVGGLEVNAGNLSGGIQVTGVYPGKARNIVEIRDDLVKAASFLPGKHRINLHAIYGDFQDEIIDRNEIEPKHFDSWMKWAKKHGFKLDFNSTSFSHPKSGELSLANPDKNIRDFWIDHTKRCRWISEEIGKYQGDPCMMNIWVHDGMKDLSVNKLKYRQLLKSSLDEIFEINYDNMIDCIEAKLFGIGAESYTVGSYDFYLGYGAKYGKYVTLDTGHFHPTESVADKISAVLLFAQGIMLHMSRPVRWDSDHVTIMNDDILDLVKEVVRCNSWDKIGFGLDFFDGSINRLGAYVIGARAIQKCFMQALLEPIETLQQYELNRQYFERLALLEECKTLPWNAVWDYYCLSNNIPLGTMLIDEVQDYEKNITSKR